MIKRKWICQSFWTKPMGESLIEKNVNIAKVSLYYAHRSGYMVRMHTDSKGYEYLKNVGYDEIVKDLDEIENDVPKCFFAYSKYIALKNEPLGVIHTDFDVFIKKPCLDMFYNDNMYDVILQCRETQQQSDSDVCYTRGRFFFKNNEHPSWFPFMHKRASNVGVIGFNNSTLRGLYLDLYRRCIDFYKNKGYTFDFCADLFFEQTNIDYLIYKYKFNVYYLLPEMGYGEMKLHKYAKELGYQHLIGLWKYSLEGQKFVENFANNLFSFRKTNIKKIWASPGIGKTYLAKRDNRFIDFDIIKKENIENYFDGNPDKYRKDLFNLFNDTCKKFSNMGKVLLVSDIELLHAFYKDFDDIYVLDKYDMKRRIIERGEDPKSNVDMWCDAIEDKISFIKNIRYVHKINGYLSDLVNNEN